MTTISGVLPVRVVVVGADGDSISPSATQQGPTVLRVTSAATTNATLVKNAAGNLFAARLFNTAGALRYMKFYDKASSPTVGSDTPLFILPLPPGGGFSELFALPVPFATGIAYAITAGVADSDATAVSANDVVGFIQYM